MSGHQTIRTILSLTCILLVLMLFPGRNAEAQQELRVLVSLFPLLEICKSIGKEHVRAELLLPPGAEPHSWEPTPSDVIKLEQADIFLMIGAGMEPWVTDILKAVSNPKLMVIEGAAAVPWQAFPEDSEQEGSLQHEAHVSHEHDAMRDPHAWLDLGWDQALVDHLVAVFSKRDPAHAAPFRANGVLYQEKLRQLDNRFRESLAQCRQHTFFVGGHAAYGHLARRYLLKQVSLYGISPNAEPTPRDMLRVVGQAREAGAKYILFESQVNDRLAKTLASEVGATTLLIRDGASPTRQELNAGITFYALMEQNLKTLTTALACP